MKQILIIADDFGFTKNINRGVVETLENGVTTEVSMMVKCYGSDDAFDYATKNNLNNVGLHLSLFDIDKGEKPFRGRDYDEVLVEWDAKKLLERVETEIKIFEDTMGMIPSHILGHKQLHLNPKLIDFVFSYAQDNNIYTRGLANFETDTTLDSDADKVKEKFLTYDMKNSDYLFGFEYDFEEPTNVVPRYKGMIDDTPEDSVIEILFHPGYCESYEIELTSFIQERESDRKLLCSNEMKQMLSEYELTYSRLID